MKLSWKGVLLVLPLLLLSCSKDKKSVVSDDKTAPDAITNLTVGGAHPNSMSLLWTATGDDGVVGRATRYDIRYSANPITEETWNSCATIDGEPTPSEPGVSDYCAVPDLSPETSYFFAVKVGDEVPNWSTISNVGQAVTSPPLDTTRPSQIVDLRVSGATALTATVEWTAPGDNGAVGTAARYDLRYSIFPIVYNEDFLAASQVPDLPAPQASGTKEQFTVRSLVPNTDYYFCLKSADEIPNWSIISNTAKGHTLVAEGVPPSAVTDLFIDTVTYNSIVLSWTSTGDDGNTGVASVYDVRYYTRDITESIWPTLFRVAGEPVPQAPGNTEHFVLSNLQSATNYWVAVKVGDEVPNWSGLSNVVNVKTGVAPDVTPPSQITDLQVDSTSRTSIFIRWLAPGDDGTFGLATGYDLRYSTSPINESNWESAQKALGIFAPNAPATNEKFAIHDLKSNTTYYIAIKTVDDVGNWSALSNVPSGKTKS